MSAETLAAEFADLEQCAIAEADHEFGVEYGAVDGWSSLEEIQYVQLIAKVHAVFHADDMAVAS